MLTASTQRNRKWIRGLAIFGLGLASLLVSSVSHAEACYGSTIKSPTPFMGNKGEVFTLEDGSVWKVISEYAYLHESYPGVTICPDSGRLAIKARSLSVENVSGHRSRRPARPGSAGRRAVVKAHIEGEFNGWQGNTVFKLDNGQIWQQDSRAYGYAYKFQPAVIIFASGASYDMQVESVASQIRVRRIK